MEMYLINQLRLTERLSSVESWVVHMLSVVDEVVHCNDVWGITGQEEIGAKVMYKNHDKDINDGQDICNQMQSLVIKK